MEKLTEVIRAALVETYGEEFIEKSDEGFYVEDEETDMGLEVVIRATT